MTILLTGSKGFLGTRIAEELNKREYDWVPLISRLDKIDSKDLNGITSVINCAALIPANDAEESRYHSTNVIGTNHLFKQCELYGIKKFIHISSMGIARATPYSESKLSSEISLKKTELDWLILRPAHIYGPNSHTLETLELLKRRNYRFIVGRGRNIISTIYVKDCATAIVNAAISDLKHKTFNITQPEITEINYLKTLRKAIDAKFLIIPVPKFIAKWKLGAKKLNDITFDYRIEGIEDWALNPASLEDEMRNLYNIYIKK
jgi:nucleoside-diphosphate-sugar epimerase